MRRLAALVLACCFLALGTGWAESLHNAQHEREDADAAALASAATDARGSSDAPSHDHPLHDETNCRVHALLHAQLLGGGWVPVLVCLGLFVAFLTQVTSPLVSLRLPARTDCRGPPAC